GHELVCAANSSQWDAVLREVLRLDFKVTHARRSEFLCRLFAEYPEYFRVARQPGLIRGYLAARPGSRATLIGPCVADPVVGSSLLLDAAERLAGKTVFIDIPLG